MQRGEQVAVDVQRHGDLGVPEHLLQHLRVSAGVDRQSRRGVPEVVHATKRGDPCGPLARIEHTRPPVRHAERLAPRSDEDVGFRVRRLRIRLEVMGEFIAEDKGRSGGGGRVPPPSVSSRSSSFRMSSTSRFEAVTRSSTSSRVFSSITSMA